jgi:indole-3-glycerol phosphate synthase
MMKQNEITYISHCFTGKISQESAESIVTHEKLYEMYEIQKAMNIGKDAIMTMHEMVIDELRQEIKNYKICFGLICALSIFVAVVS